MTSPSITLRPQNLDIIAIYSCTSPVIIKPADFPSQSSEAYLCILKDENFFKVYITLLLSANKKILVFIPDKHPLDSGDLPLIRQDALIFAESMGFKMEEINLNYSTALREVVIRNIKVLRPPPAKNKSVDIKKTGPKNESSSGNQITTTAAAVDEIFSGENAETKAPAVAPDATGKEITNNSLPVSVKAKSDNEPVVIITGTIAETERITVETVAAEKTAATQMAAHRMETIRLAEEKAVAGKIAEGRAEAVRLSTEIAAAEKAAAEQMALLRSEAELLSAEKNAMERASVEELSGMKAEAERLAAEKETIEKTSAEILAALKAEKERLAEGKERAEIDANEKLAAERAEIMRMFAEKEAAEKETAEKLAAAKAEEEKDAVRQETADKLAVVMAVDERLATEYSMAERAPVSSANDPGDPFACPEADRARLRGSSDNGAPTTTPSRFNIEKTLKMIDYSDPADIVELHRSLNIARIKPDGNSPENSSAFIIALKKNSDMRVYVPCLLFESDSIIIYVPERQPENPDDFASIIQDAVDFIEAVGFMMEPVSLSSDSQERDHALQDIPVLFRMHCEPCKKDPAA